MDAPCNVRMKEIRARVAAWNPDPARDPFLVNTKFFRHHLTTSLIDLTGAHTAKARTYFLVMTELGLDHAGTYDDEFVCLDGAWLIRRRTMSLHWRSPESLFPPQPVD